MTNIKTIYKTTGYWSTDDWSEAEKYYKEEYPDLNEEQIRQRIYDAKEMYYYNERSNLNKHLFGKILVIADLGWWDAGSQGYKILDNNLNEILNAFHNDDIHVYSDGNNILSEGKDHNRQSYYTFREIRNEKNIDNLIEDIYTGKEITPQRLNDYTRSLVPYVNTIYGWK